MSRLRQDLVVFASLLGAVACAAPADAKIKRHNPSVVRHENSSSRTSNFPVYVDRGADRNPGGDNLYFTDTKRPNYIVGPAWFQRWN